MVQVSVIVPVYNVERYLEKCLTSLLNQTLDSLEIIAVDDGSTDSSGEILKAFHQESPKLKCFHKENGGLSSARNYGLSKATGEYIGFVDSDDFVDPDMFQTLYEKAQESGSDIVECNLHHTYADGEDTEVMVKYYSHQDLICFGRHIVWNKIYKRQWLLDTGVTYPEGFIYEDVEFFTKLVPYIRQYEYIDLAPIHYMQRETSINNFSSEKTGQIFSILDHIFEFYEEKGFSSTYNTELEYFCSRIILCSSFSRICRIDDPKIRRQMLRRNWQYLQSHFPAWRKNPVLRAQKSKQDFFMKTIVNVTYGIYGRLFPFVLGKGSRNKKFK